MSTGIYIQLSPQQLETLRRGETINLWIGLERDFKSYGTDIFRSGNIPPVTEKETKKEKGTKKETQSETEKEGKTSSMMFLKFFKQQIERLQANGNARTSETYQAALKKFKAFNLGHDVAIEDIDGEMMEAMQAFLRAQGLSMNSISFYMRIVRAVYNRAVEMGQSEDRQPFTHVFTGSQTTAKRALSLKELRRIKKLVLTDKNEEFARDLFLFSFYTRGMSFVDLAYLRKEDVHAGMLAYTRRKTGHQLTMRWETEMKRIICRHPSSGPYLLPIIHKAGVNERNQYRSVQDRVNRYLKAIAVKAGIRQKLTMYCARHSWATIARERKIPVSVISHAMGHTNELTTEVYLKAIDSSVIDKCNLQMINLLN